MWYFAMTTMNQRGERIKSLKNEDRKRTVLLHPELIRLGFLGYLDDRRRAGDERLFPELKRNSQGKLTAQFSKRFGRRLRKLGISDHRKVFYSLRHTFKMAARRAMVPEDLHEALMGHSTKIVSRGHYGAHVKTLYDLLHEAISRVEYPGLRLERSG